MTDDDRTLEALKLLRESSAWMVGVQTAIFGFLISLLSDGNLALGSYFIKGAVIAFVFSILCAGIVLGAVPWVITRKPLIFPIRQAPVADLPMLRGITIGMTSGLQYCSFVIGLICLSLAVMLKQVG